MREPLRPIEKLARLASFLVASFGGYFFASYLNSSYVGDLDPRSVEMSAMMLGLMFVVFAFPVIEPPIQVAVAGKGNRTRTAKNFLREDAGFLGMLILVMSAMLVALILAEKAKAYLISVLGNEGRAFLAMFIAMAGVSIVVAAAIFIGGIVAGIRKEKTE
jgi:hypothetical protein